MVKVFIVYGTTGGNTHVVCEHVANMLRECKHTVTTKRCEITKPEELLKCDCLILASPTYGHGLLEKHFRTYFFPKIQNLNLKQKPCGVIGLGDDKYDSDYFIESAEILSEYIKNHNGNLIIEPLKIAQSPIPKLKKDIQKWSNQLSKTLKQ